MSFTTMAVVGFAQCVAGLRVIKVYVANQSHDKQLYKYSLPFSNMELEKLLIKSAKYFTLHEHNVDDAAFNRAYEKHFKMVRNLGYECQISYCGADYYMLQLVTPYSASRPELIYIGAPFSVK